MKNKSIMISILNQGWVRPEIANLMAKLPEQRKYNLFVEYPAKKPITHNRNTIVKRFLETDYDYLLMMDGDCVPPDNILDLADYNKDIIGGLCFAFMKGMIIPLCLDKNDKGTYDIAETYQDSGVMECDAIGTGNMMMSRKVLEAVPFPFKNLYWKHEGIKYKGLDIYFCEQAKKKGFKVFCDTSMMVSHWTTIDLKPMWKTFNGQRKVIVKLEDKLKKAIDDKKTIPTTKETDKQTGR